MNTQDFKPKNLNDAVQKAKFWALTHGLIRRFMMDKNENEPDDNVVIPIPFMLTPSPVPLKPFENIKKTQLDFNKLIYHVSRDYEFLCEVLSSSLKYDDFTRNLVDICKKVHEKKIKDRGTLEIIRCDYMLDSNSNGKQFKQVEINTIAAGAGTQATLLAPLHRYTLKLFGKDAKANQVPDNKAFNGIATALVNAWKVYGRPKASILLVASPADMAVYVHHHIEFKVHEIDPQIPFMKLDLGDIGMNGILTDNQELIIDGCEIAVVYYRTGYRPDFYRSQMEWNGRLLAEQSCAIKSPSIGCHLAGTKSVQQALSEPGVIEKYIDDPEAVDRIRKTFCGLYSLDVGLKGDQSVNMAIENPEKFVLKPNREAGGNNLFGSDIRTKLMELKNSPERAKYILMDKIRPVKVSGYPVTLYEPVTFREITYELGIYGTIVGDASGIIDSCDIGHLMRTKPYCDNEASLSTGRCVLDSPMLVE